MYTCCKMETGCNRTFLTHLVMFSLFWYFLHLQVLRRSSNCWSIGRFEGPPNSPEECVSSGPEATPGVRNYRSV